MFITEVMSHVSATVFTVRLENAVVAVSEKVTGARLWKNMLLSTRAVSELAGIAFIVMVKETTRLM